MLKSGLLSRSELFYIFCIVFSVVKEQMTVEVLRPIGNAVRKAADFIISSTQKMSYVSKIEMTNQFNFLNFERALIEIVRVRIIVN